MAAHDQGPGDPVGRVGRPVHVAVGAGVFGRHHQHLAAGGGDELAEPHVADPHVEGGPQEPVVVDERLDRAGAGRGHDRGLDEPAAGGFRRLVDAATGGHRRRGPRGDENTDQWPADRSTPPGPHDHRPPTHAASAQGPLAGRRPPPPRPGRAPAGNRPDGSPRRPEPPPKLRASSRYTSGTGKFEDREPRRRRLHPDLQRHRIARLGHSRHCRARRE